VRFACINRQNSRKADGSVAHQNPCVHVCSVCSWSLVRRSTRTRVEHFHHY
jgi:hypothetical protein